MELVLNRLFLSVQGYLKFSEIFGNKFLRFFIVAVLFFLFAKVVFISLGKVWRQRVNVSEFVELINRSFKVYLPLGAIFLGIDIAIEVVGLKTPILVSLSRICETAVVLVFYYIFDKASVIFINRLKEKVVSQPAWDFMPLLQKTIRTLVFISALIIVLSVWKVEVGPILTGLGIAGLAVSLALQNTLSNIFSGVSLISDRTYSIGDYIELDDGTVGMVEHIGLRSTKIITWDNEVVVVPNRILAESKIKNLSRPQKLLRLTLNFSVVYGSNPDEVEKVVFSAVKNVDGILNDPAPKLVFMNMGDYGLEFRLFVWISSVDVKFSIMDKLNREIYRLLNENKIGIPYPTHTVYVFKGEEN